VQCLFKAIEKEALQEERGTKVALYTIGTSTPLESNKSQSDTLRVHLCNPTLPWVLPRRHGDG